MGWRNGRCFVAVFGMADTPALFQDGTLLVFIVRQTLGDQKAIVLASWLMAGVAYFYWRDQSLRKAGYARLSLQLCCYSLVVA